jgi:hypothetical protein
MIDSNFTGKVPDPRIHKNELPGSGVFIVDSTDETFFDDVREELRGKDEVFQKDVTPLLPCSVFVKNTSDKDILAYKLNWQLNMNDGTVVNYPRSCFTPGPLTGSPRSDIYDNASETIKRNSKRFFTMIALASAGGGGIGAMRIDPGDVEKFRKAGATGNMAAFFVSKIIEQLDSSDDITISIENALFDDGQFVGRSDDADFIRHKAYIVAKHDLLQTIKSDIEENRSPVSEVLTRVVNITDEDIPLRTLHPGYTWFYNYFRKHHAEEIKRARKAIGDDEKTVRMFLKFLDQEWIIPYK